MSGFCQITSFIPYHRNSPKSDNGLLASLPVCPLTTRIIVSRVTLDFVSIRAVRGLVFLEELSSSDEKE